MSERQSPASRPARADRFEVSSWLGLALLVGLWVLLRWLSYPWPNQWWAAHLALVPLVVASTRARSTGKLAAAGYLGGLAWWLIGVRWLAAVTPAGYVAVCFYLALYPLAFVLLLRLVHRRAPARPPMVVAAPVLWVALEFVRGWALTGFPWFLLGHSQPTTLIQVADFAGAYGVSFLAAMTGGALVDLLSNPLVRRGRPAPTATLAAAIWLLVTGGAVGYGAWRVQHHDALLARFDGQAPGIDVAVVQTDVPQSTKLAPTFAEDQAAFAKLIELIERAGREHQPTLIGAPETVVPRAINAANLAMAERYCRMLGRGEAQSEATRDLLKRLCAATDYARRLSASAADGGRSLIVGAHALESFDRGVPEERYNAAYLVGPTGRITDRYEKVHRVPFGEYVPFKQSAPWLHRWLLALTPYEQDYSLSAGETAAPLRLKLPEKNGGTDDDDRVVRVGTPICFEDVVSHVCRAMVYGASGSKRVDVLMNLTNDGWYPGMAQGPQHEQIARFRCVENRVPMARAVNRGVSSLIDSCGRVIKRVEVDGKRQMVAGVTGGRLHFDPKASAFGRVGNVFALGCIVLAGMGMGGCIVGRRRRR